MSAPGSHLSPTQIGMWLHCGLSWYYRYVEHIKTPPNAAMVTGSSIHSAQEVRLKARLEEREELSDLDTIGYAVAQLEERIDDEGVELAKGEKAGLTDDTASYAKILTYDVLPGKNPIAVEHRYDLELEGIDAALVAVADLEEDGLVTDLKVSRNVPKAQEQLQPPVYTYCYRERYGTLPKFRYDVIRKLKTPKLDVVDVVVTELELEYFFRVMRAVVDQIQHSLETGVFLPNPTGYWCSEDWCSYFPICRGGKSW